MTLFAKCENCGCPTGSCICDNKELTALTINQKMQAISDKYYSGLEWKPKAGDYYTTSRNDLELYKIVGENTENFYTIYCSDFMKNTTEWDKSKFLKDFGVHRVLVSDYIFEM